MRKFRSMLIATSVAAVLSAGTVWADAIVINPSRVALLPADESGTARLAVYFDLSEVPSAEGLVLDEALLDWRVTGVPSTTLSTFKLFPILESWTAEGAVNSGVDVTETESDTWVITRLDYERNVGGFVRFDLKDSVGQWLRNPNTNLGVVIATEDVPRSAWIGTERLPLLTVRYGLQ
jgi:hypothetical protein